MEFLTIEAKDYDEAIKIARQRYGGTVRIQTLSNNPSSFAKKSSCVITCYLVDQKASGKSENSQVEKPKSIEAPSEVVAKMRNILESNDFSKTLIDKVIGDLVWEDAKDLTEMELSLVNSLIDSAEIDRENMLNPPRFFVLHGSAAVGKTVSLLKLSLLYSTNIEESSRRKVAILSLGGSSKLNSICELYELDVFHVGDPQALRRFVDSESTKYDLIFVDVGDIDRDLKATMLNTLSSQQVGHYLCVNARYKLSELKYTYEQIRKEYSIRSAIVTMCDEAQSIGNVLSFCNEEDIPLLFFSNGKQIESGIYPANSSYIMSLFHGFSIDFKSMWDSANKDHLI
jgi:flagellar biosynthesis protein FlhF